MFSIHSSMMRRSLPVRCMRNVACCFLAICSVILLFHGGFITGSWSWLKQFRREDRAYAERLNRVKTICDQLYGQQPRPDFFQALQNNSLPIQFLIEDRLQVLFCQIFKAGSTNIKRIFMQARNSSNEVLHLAEQDPKKAWSEGVKSYKYLTILTDRKVVERILTKYKRLLIARHPFERLVSYYRMSFELHSFENDDVSAATWTLYSAMRQAYRQKPMVANAKVNFTELVPFKAFIQFVIDYDRYTTRGDWKRLPYKAGHWLPIYKQCFPCSVNYDFIGKVETLDNDITHFSKLINVSQKIQYPEKLKRITKGLVRNYFKLLTAKQKDRLKEIYDLDMKLFGYDYFPD